MSILTDSLPVSISVRGHEVGINSGFRASLSFEEMLMQRLSEEELLQNTLNIYLDDRWKDLPADCLGELLDQIGWFYRCGRESPRKQQGSVNKGPVLSYEHDAPYIYAAFLQCGIDLQKEPELHWWRFRAVLESLPDECKLMQIIRIRSIKIDGDMSRKEKEYYRKMKKLYAIPSKVQKTERQKEIERILMEGGDLSQLNHE